MAAIEKAVPVAVQIARELEAAIIRGDFPVGEGLPSEAALAEEFGVSRPSVREALSSLQFSGYIDSVRGRGSVVVSATAIGRHPVGAGGIRRPSDLLDVLEARLLLEPQVLGQGALDPRPGALAAAERMLTGMELSLAAADHESHSDLGLHRALVHSCRNGVLVGLADSLIERTDGPLWRKVRAAAWEDPDLLKAWLAHHISMAAAVMERDADGAEAAAREHLASVLMNAASHVRLGVRDRARLDRLARRSGLPHTSAT